jgi:hypothetical protein
MTPEAIPRTFETPQVVFYPRTEVASSNRHKARLVALIILNIMS